MSQVESNDHNTSVFISYVRENSDIVDRLACTLREHGVKVWLDRDSISPGQYWKDAIGTAIQRGAYFIACFSREMNQRQETYAHSELRLAIDRLRNMDRNRIWFIPVLINDADIPNHAISDHETLSDINAISLYHNWDEGIIHILRAMKMDDSDFQRTLTLVDLIKYHPNDRGYAIGQLSKIIGVRNVPELIPALIHAIDDVDITVRQGAIEAIGRYGSSRTEAIHALIKTLRDKNKDVRLCAVNTLGKIGKNAEQSVPYLIDILSDKNSDIKTATIKALSSLGSLASNAVPALIQIFNDESDKTHKNSELCQEIVAAFYNIGPSTVEAIPVLMKALDSSDPWTRWHAVTALGDFGTTAKDAVPQVIAILNHPDLRTRCNAANALGKIDPHNRNAVHTLVNSLRNNTGNAHEDIEYRGAVVDTLGDIGSRAKEAANELLELLRDHVDARLNIRTAIALGKIGSVASSELIGYLHDKDWLMHRYAAQAFACMDDLGSEVSEVVPALIHTLNDTDSIARMEAANALGNIGPAAVAACAALEVAANDQEGYVRKAAEKALKNISSKPGTDPGFGDTNEKLQ